MIHSASLLFCYPHVVFPLSVGVNPLKIKEPKTPRSILGPGGWKHLLEKLSEKGHGDQDEKEVLDDSPQAARQKLLSLSQGRG